MAQQTCLVKFTEPTQARNAVRRLLQQGIDPQINGSDVCTADTWRANRSREEVDEAAQLGVERRGYRTAGRIVLPPSRR